MDVHALPKPDHALSMHDEGTLPAGHVGYRAGPFRASADPVVITVGSINGGTQANVVPDQVKMQLTMRAYRPEVRKRMLASIAREVKGEAIAAGAPKEPAIDIRPGADSVYNDPELTARAVAAIKGAIGEQNVSEMPAKMTSEDFASYGQAGVKAILLHVGAVEPGKLTAARAAGKYPPGTHSTQWAPDFKQSVRSFIMSETAILLDLMKPGAK